MYMDAVKILNAINIKVLDLNLSVRFHIRAYNKNILETNFFRFQKVFVTD